MGCYRTLGIERMERPHPSIGGTHGYDVVFGHSEIATWEASLQIVAHERSIRRWRNHLHPYLMNGNDQSEKIVGLDQYHMCVFQLAWPEARINEIIAFIANTSRT